MLTKKRLLVAAALMALGVLNPPAAQAQPAYSCFGLGSIEGTYAVVGHYGANVAISLGTRYFDGNGIMTGTSIVNAPDPNSAAGVRTITTVTQAGTYTVNCDGTGVITRTLTVNGVVTPQMDDFVVTATAERDDDFVTELVDAQRTPSAVVAGGIFLTRSYTRLR